MTEVMKIAEDCQALKIPGNEAFSEGGFVYVNLNNHEAMGVSSALEIAVHGDNYGEGHE